MNANDTKWLFIPIFVTPIVIGWLVGRTDMSISVWVNTWSNLMLVFATGFLTLVTGLMAYWLYKTFNHGLSFNSGKEIIRYKELFFTKYRGIYRRIMNNSAIGKNGLEREGYNMLGANSEYMLSEMLTDLEMLSIMAKSGFIRYEMIFDVFGGLLLALEKDEFVQKFIKSRQETITEHMSPPYSDLQALIKKCKKEKNTI